MQTKRFITRAKTKYVGNELHVFGIIQGLQIAICDYDKKSFGYDCELYYGFCMFITDTTQERYDKFRSIVETLYPGLCHFECKEES